MTTSLIISFFLCPDRNPGDAGAASTVKVLPKKTHPSNLFLFESISPLALILYIYPC